MMALVGVLITICRYRHQRCSEIYIRRKNTKNFIRTHVYHKNRTHSGTRITVSHKTLPDSPSNGTGASEFSRPHGTRLRDRFFTEKETQSFTGNRLMWAISRSLGKIIDFCPFPVGVRRATLSERTECSASEQYLRERKSTRESHRAAISWS